MKKEYFKIIIDFDDYLIGDYGTVISLKFNKWKVMKSCKNGNGYLHLTLTKDGIQYTKLIHQLVAEIFIENPENKQCIDHIDGNPLNNHVSNLKWSTHKENMNNPITIKRFSKPKTDKHKKHLSESHKGLQAGEKNPMYGKHHSEETRNKISNTRNKKPIVCLKDNKVIKIYNAIRDVDKDGFHNEGVCPVLKGRIKTYKGYNWMYLSEYEKIHGHIE